MGVTSIVYGTNGSYEYRKFEIQESYMLLMEITHIADPNNVRCKQSV